MTAAVAPAMLDGLTNGPVVESPLWWLHRLHKQLTARQRGIDRLDAYYRGDHPLPWLPSQAKDEFRRILRMTRSNYLGLVVDATAERLQVEGFRLAGEERADSETWRIWQANNLDSDFDQGILESLICGQAYTLTAPNGTATPDVWIEHPSQAIVEYVPGSNRRRRAAGLKVWRDDWTGNLDACLYLPAWLYKFRTPQSASGAWVAPGALQWDERRVQGEQWPARNPLGVVPLVELPNNPRLLTGGVSEIADVIDVQDRINKTVADRLITQDFGAFPQKWATGYPEDDGAGGTVPPIDIGRDRLVTTDVTETKFGQWDAASLDPYSTAKREDVKDIASRTRTPAQYLLGEMANVSGDTLKAAESGLVAKCKQRQRSIAEGAEETVRLFRLAAGLPAGDARMETVWRNPEFRTEGETTDAVIKRVQTGLADIRQGREDVGYSQTQIELMEGRETASGLDATLARVLRPVTGAPATDVP